MTKAWESADAFIALMAENMACELWENQPEAALLLDTPEGQLHTRLVGWLNIALMFAGKVSTRTPAQFIDYAQQLGWLNPTTELS